MPVKLKLQKLMAVLLLMLFALSITPKKLLHDAVARHTDTVLKTDILNTGNPLLSAAGIHCQTDNLVVISPFENNASVLTLSIPLYYIFSNSLIRKTFISDETIVFGLRGPPAV